MLNWDKKKILGTKLNIEIKHRYLIETKILEYQIEKKL